MTRTVRAACLLSLVIGLLFVFVRAPHPWGWNGFDHYHELALALASGQPFPTLEVPWGYAYFLSIFYRLFGDRPWIPLLVQVALNAITPILLFSAARRWTDRATASIAALLVGAFSFNTVYASTQSSDAICTVLFLTAILIFMTAVERGDDASGRGWFALVGVVTGVMSQFRPNLILIPGLFAAYAIWKRPVRRSVVHAAVLLLCAGAALTPWIVRNYRLTKTVLPTSVHGGAQLWYGTLQTGKYLDSRGYNPRSIFESPAFEYTSLDGVPILIDGGVRTCAIDERHGTLSLLYWTDGDPVKRRLSPQTLNPVTGRFTFELPAPDADAVYYYYFEAAWPSDTGTTVVDTPALGATAPSVYFVSQDHLGDLDRYNDLLDIFDVIRFARHDAWGEPVAAADALRRAGAIDTASAVRTLLRIAFEGHEQAMPAIHLDHDDRTALITIGDSSTITIPRAWHERLTDVTIAGPQAEALMYARTSLAALTHPAPAVSKGDATCGIVGEVKINNVFYREQPQSMRRYSALAIDNIRREPLAFLEASLYRVYRVFVVVGSTDKWTNQQFTGATAIYAVATALSLVFLVLFLAGIVILWRRGADILLPLLLILYVPATIAPLLTNMRYSVTVQPLMFVFVAASLMALWKRLHRPS